MTIATDSSRSESLRNLQASPSLSELWVRAHPLHIDRRTPMIQEARREFGFWRFPQVQLSPEGTGPGIPGSATTTHISPHSTEGPLEDLLWKEFPTPV